MIIAKQTIMSISSSHPLLHASLPLAPPQHAPFIGFQESAFVENFPLEFAKEVGALKLPFEVGDVPISKLFDLILEYLYAC
jgi:hypothetical protein